MAGGNTRISPLWLSVTLVTLWDACHLTTGLVSCPRCSQPKLVDWCFWWWKQEDNLSQTTKTLPRWVPGHCSMSMSPQVPMFFTASVCPVHCTAAWDRHGTLQEEVSQCLPWIHGNPAVSCLCTVLHVVPGKVHLGREMGSETWGGAR